MLGREQLARRFCSRDVTPLSGRFSKRAVMADQIVITEKSSQAKDVRAAVGSRYGEILPAEGHLFDLLEPEECRAGVEALVADPAAARRPLRHSPGVWHEAMEVDFQKSRHG